MVISSVQLGVVELRAMLLLVLPALVFALKIGVILPMSGDISSFGIEAWKGIRIGYEMRPKVGEEVVELILVDNSGDPEKSKAAVEKLHRKGVVAIIGPVSSENSYAAGEVAEEIGIPEILPVATNPLVTEGRKYVSRVCFTDLQQGKAAAKFAIEFLKAKRAVVFMDVEQKYSVGLTRYFNKFFREMGGVSRVITYRSGERDFYTEVLKTINYSPQVVFITGYYPEAVEIIRQLRDRGYRGYIMGGDGIDSPQLIARGGEYVEGVYVISHFNPKVYLSNLSNLSKEFTTRFEKFYKTPPNTSAALAFDSYMMLTDILERILKDFPSMDLKTLRRILAGEIRKVRDFEGVTGTISIDEDGNAVKPVIVNVVRNGSFEMAKIIHLNEDESDPARASTR